MQRTPEQEAIISFTAENPQDHLMVSARAGAGKTSTIVMAAQEIHGPFLAVAFNKKIATELKERLPQHGEAKTMNAIGHGAWWGKLRINLTLDADKMYRLVKQAFEKADPQISDPDGLFFASVLGMTRWAKSVGLVPSGVSTYPKGLVQDHPDTWADAAFDKGLEWDPELLPLCKKILHTSIRESHSGTIDFDDQIYMSALFGGQFKKFPTVIVDESQDLSPLNHLILTKIVGTRLIMIGDPYQAIYGFRGADSNSMTNLADMFGQSIVDSTEPMAVLPLTQTFRCARKVVARQLYHVPDFQAHECVADGEILHWPPRGTASWSVRDIPERGAILCRNNAPLMRVAFALISARRPVTILGRDLGVTLAALLTKIVGKENLNTSVQTSVVLVQQWAKKEIEKLGNRESKKEAIYDREECLTVLLESSGGETAGDCVTFIKDLFTDRPDKLTLASGHRSKGLEWDWVMHLDQWRVPSRFANAQAAQGNPIPLVQERNLRYVIETRTKHTLVEANSDDCIELDRREVETSPKEPSR